MARSKKSLYVIFSGPQQHKGPGTKYYTRAGSDVTDMKYKAAKFYSFDDAKEFAGEKGIELTAFTYIGQEDFSEHALSLE